MIVASLLRHVFFHVFRKAVFQIFLVFWFPWFWSTCVLTHQNNGFSTFNAFRKHEFDFEKYQKNKKCPLNVYTIFASKFIKCSYIFQHRFSHCFFIDFSWKMTPFWRSLWWLFGDLFRTRRKNGSGNPFGHLFWHPFGLPLAPFGFPLAPFGSLLPHFGLPLASLWLPLALFWLPFGSLWLIFTHLRTPFSHCWPLLALFFCPFPILSMKIS